MVQIKKLLEILNNLISCTIDETVNIRKVSLVDIRVYLHDASEKFEFLQTESQIQQDDPHYEQQSQSNEAIFGENLDVVKSPDVKPVIIPWEEITHNKDITTFGYNKDVLDISFHIPHFSKPIQFCTARFLDCVVLEQID